MSKPIIAAIDGSSGGRDAGALAGQLARSSGARLFLAHVYPYDILATRAANPGVERRIHDDATYLLQTECLALGVEAELFPVGDTSVARGLHRLARRQDADLIVVGSRHRGRSGRLLLGDDAHATLHGAPCAIAVAPAGYAQHGTTFARIGVGFDGSPGSQRALAAAAELARATHAQLELLTVVEDAVPASAGYPYLYDTSAIAEERRKRARVELDAALSRLDVPAGARVVVGLPAQKLQRFSHAVDLLVIGSRGFGPLLSVLLGSTSRHLVDHSECPVVILPRGWQAEAGTAHLSEPVPA